MIIEYRLDNGLSVAYEHLPHLRSVAFGVWIGTGSRFETPERNGISHFIEHMVFKGTARRTARQIAQETDVIGGQVNAFTSRECTCFYTKTLDQDLPQAMDIMADMLFESRFADVHIETEKKVVLEEIGMAEDFPEELVCDDLTERVWSDHALSFPILGTRETVAGFDVRAIRETMAVHYRPDNAVISVVGNFDPAVLREAIERHFGAWRADAGGREAVSAAASLVAPVYQPLFTNRRKDIEQMHLCIGYPGVATEHPDFHAMLMLNNLLGGGMSSRLFQSIREEEGLVYSIYSFPTTYQDSGLFSIYAATNPDAVDEVFDRTADEIAQLLAHPPAQEEIDRHRRQLVGSYLLSLDSTSTRMSGIGKAKVISGRIRTTEEILAAMEAVTASDIARVAEHVFRGGEPSLAVIGPEDPAAGVLDRFRFRA